MMFNEERYDLIEKLSVDREHLRAPAVINICDIRNVLMYDSKTIGKILDDLDQVLQFLTELGGNNGYIS